MIQSQQKNGRRNVKKKLDMTKQLPDGVRRKLQAKNRRGKEKWKDNLFHQAIYLL